LGRVDGKTAVITGGARGQGRSHAVLFAREGADVVICDVAEQIEGVPYPLGTEEDMAETARLVEEQDRRCVTVKADTRSEADMRRVADTAIAEFGKIDTVVVNHGLSIFAPKTWELSEEQWRLTIDTNLTGVWQTCKAVVPHMIEAGNGGSIGITSSTAGITGFPYMSHYSSAKHGIVGLMLTLAIELAPHNIRVNTVHPCATETPMISNDYFDRWMEDHPDISAGTIGLNMGNLLAVDRNDPIDVSYAYLYLASDEARHVTGMQMRVDAGYCAKP
jgi:SDR family mycofactocin-dependent oxidoreductase